MNEPKLLAIDSATEFCSVAYSDGQQLIIRGEEAPRRHADLLLPYVEAVLAEAQVALADLDAIVVGRGPGSFTGVRIAAGIAQGLAFSQNLPLVGISSLQAMAQQAWRLHGVTRVIAAIDARMGEVYAGTCRQVDGLMIQEQADVVCAPLSILSTLQLSLKGNETFAGVGTGFETYTSELINALQPAQVKHLDDVRFPHAQDMLALGRAKFLAGEALKATEFDLDYVRNEVTWQKLPGRG